MDFNILEFNGESDHIHVLLEYPPKLSISQMVNSLKGVSGLGMVKQDILNPMATMLFGVLVTLCQQLGVRHSKFLKSTSNTKKSRRSTTGFKTRISDKFQTKENLSRTQVTRQNHLFSIGR